VVCNCTNLTHFSVILGLEKLDCEGCTNLTEIPVIPGLKELYCSMCTSLTQIPSGLEILDCTGCPWVEQNNPDFQHNLSDLIKLQKWVRKYHPLRILRKWMATEDFARWYYHPENPGGLRQKAKMRKFFGEISR
jgi:hypothetical protein